MSHKEFDKNIFGHMHLTKVKNNCTSCCLCNRMIQPFDHSIENDELMQGINDNWEICLPCARAISTLYETCLTGPTKVNYEEELDVKPLKVRVL